MRKQVLEQRQSLGIAIPTLIASDIVEDGSTKLKIKASSHLAQVNDILRFTSAGNCGIEYYVLGIETDYIYLNQILPLSVGPGDTFQILRLGYSSDGNLPVSTEAIIEAVIPSEVIIAFSSIGVSYAEAPNALVMADDAVFLQIDNGTDKAVIVSVDNGTTESYNVPSYQIRQINFAAMNRYLAQSTIKQKRSSEGAPTVGNLRICVVY